MGGNYWCFIIGQLGPPVVKKDMADDRESNCFDDRTVLTADTERCLLNFDSTNLQYLQLNSNWLTWTSDLESRILKEIC